MISWKVMIWAFVMLTVSVVLGDLAWADADDLVWSTFLGGSANDEGQSIAIGSDGGVYVVGWTASLDFPTSPNAVDTSFNGGGSDIFVFKLSPFGSELAYSTFLGGSASLDGREEAWDIAVDASNRAYVTGWTRSSDFPTTPGAFDTSFNGDTDVFVVKLNGLGSALQYATFVGRDGHDYGFGIALDASGHAFVTGNTECEDFPLTAGAFDTTYNGGLFDIFVIQLNTTGSALAYGTLLGGSDWDHGQDIALDAFGHIYVTGSTRSEDFPTTSGVVGPTFRGDAEGFVARFDLGDGGLDFATYLGGWGWDQGDGIALDTAGNAFVVGHTKSPDFPTTPGAIDRNLSGGSDAFVVKLDSMGVELGYGTYLGGGSSDYGHDIAVDGTGRAYVIGETNSADFPTSAGAFDRTFNGGSDDVFVTVFDPTGSSFHYSTFLGGSGIWDRGNGIALDGSGATFVIGKTYSSDFPTTTGCFDNSYNGNWDVFMSKLSLSATSVESHTPGASLPKKFALHQNHPNPFNGMTEIGYAVPRDAHVSLKVYNILGAEVATLVDGHRQAGVSTVRWDARGLASGVYLCQLEAGEYRETMKMILLK